MGVGKVLWKLKGLILFVVLILVIVIVVAMMINKDKNVVAPEVSAGNVVKDKEPNDSFKSPQKTGLTLTLDDWIQINGKHDKEGDNDKFDFKIADGVNAYEIQCWQEVLTKDNTKKLSVNSSVLFGFPLSLACYDKAGDVVSNILAAGSGNGQNFHEGTAKITASVATVKEKEGPGVHEQGREYKIYIKGQYKEPKAKKNASIHATNLTKPWPQVIHLIESGRLPGIKIPHGTYRFQEEIDMPLPYISLNRNPGGSHRITPP